MLPCACRLYGRDPTADFSVPYGTGASLWGFVLPPTVERKARKSKWRRFIRFDQLIYIQIHASST